LGTIGSLLTSQRRPVEGLANQSLESQTSSCGFIVIELFSGIEFHYIALAIDGFSLSREGNNNENKIE
jgi:hypothetical protein